MSEKKTISQKIDELNKDTEWFYSNDFDLDEAVKKYKEAIKMAKELNEDLDSLRNEIEILAEDFSK